jgi:hypothetical protein
VTFKQARNETLVQTRVRAAYLPFCIAAAMVFLQLFATITIAALTFTCTSYLPSHANINAAIDKTLVATRFSCL